MAAIHFSSRHNHASGNSIANVQVEQHGHLKKPLKGNVTSTLFCRSVDAAGS